MTASETGAGAEVSAEVNGVRVWVGPTDRGTAARVFVLGEGAAGWSSASPDAVAYGRAVAAGAMPPEVLADYLDENPEGDGPAPARAGRAASLLRAHRLPIRVHVRVWMGSGAATVVDMTDAGRRGKRCRALRFGGWINSGGSGTPQGRASDFSYAVCSWLAGLSLHADFDAVRAELLARLAAFRAAAAEWYGIDVREHELRAVDAPKPPLTAGAEGKWSARADEEGVSVHALDDVNEWTEISGGRQHPNEAYRRAAKVWDRVRAAKDRHEARAALEAAGCKFHGYCGRD